MAFMLENSLDLGLYNNIYIIIKQLLHGSVLWRVMITRESAYLLFDTLIHIVLQCLYHIFKAVTVALPFHYYYYTCL